MGGVAVTITPTDRVGLSFRRSLPSYTREASPQKRIARLLVKRLLRVCPEWRFNCAFEFGCGTGNLTLPLAQELELGRLFLNDLVADVAHDLPVRPTQFIAGPVETVPWPATPDLIASASALQWVEDPAALIQRLAELLQPKGWMAISTFGPDQFKELVALGSDAGAPGYMTDADLSGAMAETLDVRDSGMLTCRLWFDDPRDVLRHLRETGVNGRAKGGWTRRDLERFCSDYLERFAVDGRVPLTYQPVWAIATRA
nr:methyltransferase domain-containing protein [Donghicola mangrovi]